MIDEYNYSTPDWSACRDKWRIKDSLVPVVLIKTFSAFLGTEFRRCRYSGATPHFPFRRQRLTLAWSRGQSSVAIGNVGLATGIEKEASTTKQLKTFLGPVFLSLHVAGIAALVIVGFSTHR